jgi:hypothetical protein
VSTRALCTCVTDWLTIVQAAAAPPPENHYLAKVRCQCPQKQSLKLTALFLAGQSRREPEERLPGVPVCAERSRSRRAHPPKGETVTTAVFEGETDTACTSDRAVTRWRDAAGTAGC